MSLYRRGQTAFKKRVEVGAALYHTVGDRERALKQLNTEFRVLTNEVMTLAGWQADPYQEASGVLWSWWKMVGVPVLEEWQAFFTSQMGNWGTRFATNWGVYEKWWKRLKGLRESVEEQGVKLNSPSPSELPTTILADVGSSIRKKGGDIIDIVTVGSVVVGGGALLMLLSSFLKSRKQQ